MNYKWGFDLSTEWLSINLIETKVFLIVCRRFHSLCKQKLEIFRLKYTNWIQPFDLTNLRTFELFLFWLCFLSHQFKPERTFSATQVFYVFEYHQQWWFSKMPKNEKSTFLWITASIRKRTEIIRCCILHFQCISHQFSQCIYLLSTWWIWISNSILIWVDFHLTAEYHFSDRISSIGF